MSFEVDVYRPLPRRRRLLIALLAVAAAVVVTLVITRKSHGVPGRPAAAPPAVCADGRGSGCVGGKTEVIVLPAAAPASAN